MQLGAGTAWFCLSQCAIPFCTLLAGAELLWSRRELTTKVREQPWPQLICCASICCCMCGYVFQEDGIVVRSAREEWYID